MNGAAIHIEGLAARAGGRTILSLDDLRIAPGEFVAVLGPNGAGKTTLLKACMGERTGRLSAGRAEVLGRAVLELSGGRLTGLRRSIGYVRQLLPVAGEMPLTVREVVAMGRTGLAGLLRPLSGKDWAVVDRWLDRLGLADLARRGYGEISGGQQRKALIARAMVQQPKLLLLDEPTANLDLGWREAIVALIAELHAVGDLTVLLVCHELEVLPACCRRVVVLDGGRKLIDGRPETVLDAAMIARLYGSGLDVLHRGGRMAVVPVGHEARGGGDGL